MKNKKLSKNIVLSVILVLILLGGTIFLSSRNTSNSKVASSNDSEVSNSEENTDSTVQTNAEDKSDNKDNKDKDNKDKKSTNKFYHNELIQFAEVNETTGVTCIYQVFNNKNVKLKFTEEGYDIINIEDNTKIGNLSKDISQNTDCLYFDNEGNVYSFTYGISQNNATINIYDKEYKLISGPIDIGCLEINSKGYMACEKIMADKDYIYLFNSNTLCIVKKNGELYRKYNCINDFTIDGIGNLYIVYANDPKYRSYKGFDKIRMKYDDKVYSMKVTNAYDDIYYNQETNMLYMINDKSIDKYSASEGRYMSKIFNIYEDASFLMDDIHLANFCVDKNDNVYMSALMKNDGEDSIYNYYKYEKVYGTKDEIPVTLTITVPFKNEFISDCVVRFEKDFPDQNIELDYAYNNADEFRQHAMQYRQQMITKIIAGDIGDIVMTGGSGLSILDVYKTDAFLDLTDYIEKDKNIDKLNKNALEGATINGAIRGIPFSISCNGCEVSVEVAEKLGIDADTFDYKWSDILSLIDELENTEYYLFAENDIESVFNTMLVCNMSDLVDFDKKEFNFKEEWFKNLMIEFKQASSSQNFLQDQEGYEKNYGKALVCYRALNHDYKDIISSYCMDGEIDDISMFIKPVLKGELSANRIGYAANMYSINGRSENIDNAWKFLSYMMDDKIQSMKLLRAGKYGFPVNMDKNDVFIETGIRWTKANLGDEYEQKAIKYGDMLKKIYTEIDYTYELDLYIMDVTDSLMKYINDELSLDEAISEAENKAWIRLNE